MTNRQNIKIYLLPDTNAWDSEKSSELINAFKPLKAKVSNKAMRAGGASGPYPELSVLIDFVSANYKEILDIGIKAVVGNSIWEGLKKMSKIKPKPQNLEDYGLGNNVVAADLYLQIKVQDKIVPVSMLLKNEEDYDNAFNALPHAIDKALKSKQTFGRLYWADGKWKTI